AAESKSSIAPRQFCELPDAYAKEIKAIAESLSQLSEEHRKRAAAEALLIVSNEKAMTSSSDHYPAGIKREVDGARGRLEAAGVEWQTAAIEGRYARVAKIYQAAVTETFLHQETFSDKLDRVLTHKIWGTLIFV